LIAATVVLAPPPAKQIPLDNGMGGPVESLPPPPPLPLTRVVDSESADTDIDNADSDGADAPDDLVTDAWADLLDPAAADAVQRCDFRIGKGQSFYEALTALGAGHEEVVAVVRTAKPFRNLSKVKRGDRFWAELHADGGLQLLGFDLDFESYVEYVRVGDGYEMRQGAYPVERRISGVSGVVTVSLYESLASQGAPQALAPKLNDILGWEIDFARDVRVGDTYRLIYEEIWREGQFLRTGPILAAEYVNRDEPHRVFRFAMPDGRPG
jgi:hypothetical protein